MGTPFPTTRVSALRAGESADLATRELGFSRIVEVYWKPVYVYVRLHHRRDEDSAADLTQEFFARAWERRTFASFDPSKGRFRTFVRTCLDRFVINEHVAASRLKRGGAFDFTGAEDELLRHRSDGVDDPDVVFEKEWIRALMQRALDDLRSIDARRFAIFEAYELGEDTTTTYGDLAARFGLTTIAVTNALAAARRDLRRLLLKRLRDLTATEEEYRAEAQRIFGGVPR